ncbi:hypothetical protein [Terriglobus roseus]|nr:hypothetical protein [Terriglobus roseus]
MFLGNATGILNQIVSGFQINPVVTYSSGLPFTITSNNSGNWVPGSAPSQPNGEATRFYKTVTGRPGANLRYFTTGTLTNNPYGFSAPALDTVGNLGRNTVYGPRLFTTDLSLLKNFTIRERYSFQLRADAFNAFNHINFGNPGGSLETGGTITAGPFVNGANPRQMQFAVRIQF